MSVYVLKKLNSKKNFPNKTHTHTHTHTLKTPGQHDFMNKFYQTF